MYAGFDQFGRIVDQKWVGFDGTTTLDRYQYAYDRNSNRTSKDNTLTTDLDELYAYDHLDRLTNMDRGQLSGGAIAAPVKEADWTLDATGNWSGYVTKTSGTTDNASWAAAATAVDWTLGHQGLVHDGESGLVYNRARYLHPQLGRFTQRDPLGYVDSTNLYEYVLSSPTNALDPSGHKSWTGRFLDCLEDCLDHNDPVSGLLNAILAAATAERAAELLYRLMPSNWIAMNKNRMISIAERLGERRVAEAIRRNLATPGKGEPGSLKTFIEMLKRRGETATRMFNRDFKPTSKVTGALAAVMAVVELGRYTHCSGMCSSLASSKCEYDPAADNFIEDYLRYYNVID